MANRKLNITEDMLSYLKEHWATTRTADIAAVWQCSVPTVEKYAHKLGLRKDPAWLCAIKVARLNETRAEFNERRKATISKVMRDKYRVDRVRLSLGLAPLTKLNKPSKYPRALSHQAWYLARNGYKVDIDNRIAYYTDDTRRCRNMERRTYGSFRSHSRFSAYGRLFFDFKPLNTNQL